MTDTSLIPEKEVMNKLGVSSRQTIWKLYQTARISEASQNPPQIIPS